MVQILIIDDDPGIQRMLQKAIEKEGYQVKVAGNGKTGIELAYTGQPALIICDWVMPEMDGLEVCRQVKANPALSTTFFILLTARNSLEDRVLGLDTGADDFLAKPIEISELKARIRAGLRVYQLTTDLQHQKELLESELTEASQYVRSLLPPSLESPIPVQTTFIPSRQLGGDCFDYGWLPSGELVLFLLDMSGHGLGAALPSVSILNLLRSQSLPEVDFRQPSQVLTALNRFFQMGSQGDKYFTLWYGIYSPKTRSLIYASAGHPPALLVSPSAVSQGSHPEIEIQSLRTKGFPIGMFPDSQYGEAQVKICPSSALYIFSDGVYEIPQADGSIWGLPRFMELLRSLHLHNNPNVHDIHECLVVENNSPIFQDDISLIKVQF
jgi:sigma-B regulation protein RsbU (phosphoserine phosphatase)